MYLYRQISSTKKAFALFPEHFKMRTPSHTYGGYVKVSDMGLNHRLDFVQVTQMAKYPETVYVSGWQLSSTASSTYGQGRKSSESGCWYAVAKE